MATKKYTINSNGYYETQVWDGTYTKTGRKHRVHLRTKKSSRELERMVKEMEDKVRNRELIRRTDVIFCDYAEEWFQTYKASTETNTKIMYRGIIDRYFSQLGNLKLCDIEKIHFQRLINFASEKPNTCRKISLTFRQVIKSAVHSRLLPADAMDTICGGVTIPKLNPKKKRALSKEEREAVFKADFTDRERTFVYLIYYCGLRREEALGLMPIDVDLKKKMLHVRRALIFNGNKSEIKGTKSASGVRDIPMPDALCDHLRSVLHTCGDFIIEKNSGGEMTHSAYRRMWESIDRKINEHLLEEEKTHLTAHMFRHNYCTNLCYQIPAISIDTVARLLGDDKKMVLDVYSHIMDEREDVAGSIEKALNF